MGRELYDLDIGIGYEPGSSFKSAGEQKIACFLERNSIGYQYEAPVLVQDERQKSRIWYPDFYLNEFKTYLEYFGLAGDRHYDKGIKTKLSVYKSSGIDVIPFYPWMFKENWNGYLMQRLEDITHARYQRLRSKPYWAFRKPSFTSYRKASYYSGKRARRYC